ncbi:MAG TPA: GreA/GreB family elongation factor [Candidatus Baltobacteraceae bacterium]|jgi:transcription elongation GreA/GreB family factor|nr:GreA/GreB family elongation factor [Candidatus Baltobacteraceae bacterium]
MSRAFVKDDDDGPEPAISRPISDAPNRVTPRGLDLLKAALAQAESDNNEREMRYYRERIETAIVVDAMSHKKDVVEFGATVTAHDDRGAELRVRIVGEDEADPLHGSISAESPIAQAMLEHRCGDRVVVQRPAGPIEYSIDTIAYD